LTSGDPGAYSGRMVKASLVWHNGKMIAWEDATVHVLAHALHYGTSVFEGIRCYRTQRGSEVLRLRDHMRRLHQSAKIYRMEIPYDLDELQTASLETIRANQLEHCYIRPLVFRGVGPAGVNPLKNPVESYILTWEWGKYLGDDAIESGVDVCISSWRRAAPDTFPTMAKAGGNYLSSSLVKMEAVLDGYSEGITLDSQGFLSEGSGENVFLFWRDKLWTPPVANAILPGITRDIVITLAQEAGIEVVEQQIPREMLYLADEVFMTGTAAEITPVRSIDHVPVGSGTRGPVTARLQQVFFEYVEGSVDDRFNWMTPVYSEHTVGHEV
jgi:branched-chain amino acid aminotransferase